MQTSPLDVANYDDGGLSVLFECYGVAGEPSIDLREMGGKVSGGVSLDCTAATLAVVLADILVRKTADLTPYVTEDHLRTLGLDDALLAAAELTTP